MCNHRNDAAAIFDRRDGIAFLSLLGALLVVYAGVLLLPYAFLDDYGWLDLSLYSPGEIYPALAAQGRPLNAIILRFAFQQAGGLGGMQWVRLVTVAGLAGMGWMFYFAASRAGWGRSRAALLAGMACVVPSTQVYAAWTTSVPIPFSGILAGTAAVLTGWAMRHRRRWPALAISPGLIVLSAAIYQPTAMVFCAVGALDLFRTTEEVPGRSDLAGFVRRAVGYAAVAGAGLFLGWCVYRHGLSQYRYVVKSTRDGFSQDFAGKFSGFLRNPLMDSLNLFWLESTTPIAVATAVFIIIGLTCYFRGPIAHRLTMLILAAALVPLSYAPSLLAKTDEWSYRTQIGMSWMVLVLLWLAINGLWQSLGRIARAPAIRRLPLFAVIAAACLSGALATYNTIVLIAWPQAIEQSLLRIEMLRPDVRAAGKLVMLQPGWGDSPAPLHRYDEFGVPSMMASWVPVPAIHLLRCETIPNPSRLHVQRIEGFQGTWSEALRPGRALIDMRCVRNAR